MTRLVLLLALCLPAVSAQSRSPLLARGYTVLPEPRKVTLAEGDLRLASDWRIETGPGIASVDVAMESLRDDMLSRYQLRFSSRGNGGVIRLAIQPGSVEIGPSLDRDKTVLAEQAYRIDLSGSTVVITANAAPGLFYGVQTFVQLVKRENGELRLPQGQIVDWPDLQLRTIYWDDAHHLDRPDYLKRAIRQAAFFKINGFAIKLEGHFQYQSAPAIVEPYALTPAELQDLTDYGLRYHVQVIPFLDGPSHIAFILKHPEYARLREYPNSNYQLCSTNPDSYKLLLGMFQDLLAANKGGKYFYLSTDEPYYIGLANNPQCQEALRAQQLGSVGKLLAEFLSKTASFLKDRGRTVFFWGEAPLKPEDIPSLPPYLVNGETYGRDFDAAFKARGIREMVYVSTQGAEQMFPDYFLLPESKRLHPRRGGAAARVQQAAGKISTDPARTAGDVMGAVVAGWADSGLHQETFWLGYATIPAAAWNPEADPQESMSAFYPLFYGRSAKKMDRVYELMSWQAQFFADSWETGPGKARKPIVGNSFGMFDPPRPANDQSVPLPPAPSGTDLGYTSTWAAGNARRLQLVTDAVVDNQELIALLDENLKLVENNRYNLEVFRSIAQLYRQNLDILRDLSKIDGLFVYAHEQAKSGKAKDAVAAIDDVLKTTLEIRNRRNAALADTVAVWYKTWYPRVAEANGRRFVHELDDVKDHLPDRTVDMSYLVYRQLILPLGEWYDVVLAARNQYAQANKIGQQRAKFDWKDTRALR